jgi:hypothetical protein
MDSEVLKLYVVGDQRALSKNELSSWPTLP